MHKSGFEANQIVLIRRVFKCADIAFEHLASDCLYVLFTSMWNQSKSNICEYIIDLAATVMERGMNSAIYTRCSNVGLLVRVLTTSLLNNRIYVLYFPNLERTIWSPKVFCASVEWSEV